MTLSTRLIFLITVIALSISAGTLWISVDNTRNYLNLQMGAQAGNSVESLGMSLAPYMQARDIGAMDTVVNAVFDSGFYQSLRVETIRGDLIIERRNATSVDQLPDWFIRMLPLNTEYVESLITTGWSQVGRVFLQPHPGFAYKKLWQTTIETAYWAGAIFLISMFLSLWFLKLILRPLKEVEHQALAITERDFVVVKEVPRARELRRVVFAMNSMSEKLCGYIEMLSERAERMRKLAYDDELTGMLNRKGFMAAMQGVLRDRESGGHGVVVLVRIRDLEEYVESAGFRAGDELVREIAAVVKAACEGLDSVSVARIRRSDLAVLIPLGDDNSARRFTEHFESRLTSLSENIGRTAPAHAGITVFHAGSEISTVMGDADAALAGAVQMEAGVYRQRTSENEGMGKQAWMQVIQTALEQQCIAFVAQPVLSDSGDVLYKEVLMRVHDAAGKSLSPAMFSAMANRLHLSVEVDRFVVESVAQMSSEVKYLAVNLSADSVVSEHFVGWLNDYLSSPGVNSSMMLFEVTEFALANDIEASQKLISMLRNHGCRVVVERFGTRLSSFKILRELKPDLIKLDGSHLRNIDEDADSRFFVRTICDISHGLGISVIAEQVETEKEREVLLSLGINAMQGYYFGKPEPL